VAASHTGGVGDVAGVIFEDLLAATLPAVGDAVFGGVGLEGLGPLNFELSMACRPC